MPTDAKWAHHRESASRLRSSHCFSSLRHTPHPLPPRWTNFAAVVASPLRKPTSLQILLPSPPADLLFDPPHLPRPAHIASSTVSVTLLAYIPLQPLLRPPVDPPPSLFTSQFPAQQLLSSPPHVPSSYLSSPRCHIPSSFYWSHTCRVPCSPRKTPARTCPRTLESLEALFSQIPRIP